MKIGIIGSMQFTEKMVEVQNQLNSLGHEAFVTDLHDVFIGKSDEEKEIIKIEQKNNQDAIREFWHAMQGADAVLVLNIEKHGIPNYIGGNTLMEIGFAHVLNQKVFLWNPIPDIRFYKTEIEAVKPIIIHGDLSKITDTVQLGKYQHFKGTIVEVTGSALHSETMEEMVVYNHPDPMKGKEANTTWVRPKEMFLGTKVIDGKEIKRFKKI